MFFLNSRLFYHWLNYKQFPAEWSLCGYLRPSGVLQSPVIVSNIVLCLDSFDNQLIEARSRNAQSEVHRVGRACTNICAAPKPTGDWILRILHENKHTSLSNMSLKEKNCNKKVMRNRQTRAWMVANDWTNSHFLSFIVLKGIKSLIILLVYTIVAILISSWKDSLLVIRPTERPA